MAGMRGSALVATSRRWAVGTLVLAAGVVVATEGALGFVGAHRPIATLAVPMAVATIVGSALLWGTLRAEESRLARELRLARTGTAVLRESAIGRRDRAPFFARLLSTQLGFAAVLLADGDLAGAESALASASAVTRGGRVDELRLVVDADVERAGATEAGRAACITKLQGAKPTGNREADLYRLHVLTKAILEQGDGDAAVDLAGAIATSPDDDVRIYATWLRTWFDLDEPGGDGGRQGLESTGGAPWPQLSEAEIRLAALVARAQGADSLVTKLDARLVAIAPPERRG
jgi:hypothetical protein